MALLLGIAIGILIGRLLTLWLDSDTTRTLEQVQTILNQTGDVNYNVHELREYLRREIQ